LQNTKHVGDALRQVNANEVVRTCVDYTRKLMMQSYGPECPIPEVVIEGDLTTTFPYPVSHLEYIVGELLRNSIQAAIEQTTASGEPPKPIEILICQNPQQAIIRISDQAGGISPPTMEHIWSFSKGPYQANRLENLNKVPKLAATMTDMEPVDGDPVHALNSLSSLSTRSPVLRLGIGLPMSKTYAEFWAGNLAIQNLEGYGTDAFLEISKLGNKNEHITTRATIDSV
jgi:pyruvate dehydrogenase kinase 2/3/4